jgi:hypothetical protein
VVQIDQCGQFSTRRADLHSRPGYRIQHPRSQDRDYAQLGLDVNYIAIGSSLLYIGSGHDSHEAGATGSEQRRQARHGQNDPAIALSRKNSLFACICSTRLED